MEFVLLGALAVLAVIVVALVAKYALAQSQKGWVAASESDRLVRQLLIARITTLENRVDSRSWQEFDALQRVPDEIVKSAWAEKTRAENDPAFQALAQRLRDEGADLESSSDSLEDGPIIG